MKNHSLRIIRQLILTITVLSLLCIFSSVGWAECKTHTSTVMMHVIAGRAYAVKAPDAGCGDPTTYYLKNDKNPPLLNSLGDDPYQVITIYTDDSGASYNKGECPPDMDGDGYHKYVDCDDNDFKIHPGAEELCGDGIDQNCDGLDIPCGPLACQEFTATLQEHEDAGRVSIYCACDCWYLLKGSGIEYDDDNSATIVTLFTIDGGESFYVGTCP